LTTLDIPLTALRTITSAPGLPAIAASFPLALAMGALYAWRNPEHPTSVAVTVMAACTWPIIAIALQILWFERSEHQLRNRVRTRGRRDRLVPRGRGHSLLHHHGRLLFLDSIGSALKLGPGSQPVGLTHALVLGIGSFALSYLSLRRRDR
jgi:hypothetical protein